VFAGVWFFAIYLIVTIALGAIVDVLGSGQAKTEEAAYAAARAASEAFLGRYIFIVLLCVLALVFGLSWYQILPGTNRLRGPDQTISRRWFASPSWFRYVLTLLIVVVAGGVWGFVSVFFGAPRIITALGVVIIAPAIFVVLNRDDK
jgi:hypothetical protein